MLIEIYFSLFFKKVSLEKADNDKNKSSENMSPLTTGVNFINVLT